MASDSFKFRQFEVSHSRCAQKVGLDSILLGALADGQNARTALDAGAGCGLLALMLAQRFPELKISGIEVEEDAAKQCAENFSSSPWSGRLEALCGDVMAYCRGVDGNGYDESTSKKVDLIISNPPYFAGQTKASGVQRAMARQGEGFTYECLPQIACSLLKDDGKLWTILPLPEAERLIDKASAMNLWLHRRLLIAHRQGAAPRRMVMAFGFEEADNVTTQILELHTPEGQPTQEFHMLCSPFYLTDRF